MAKMVTPTIPDAHHYRVACRYLASYADKMAHDFERAAQNKPAAVRMRINASVQSLRVISRDLMQQYEEGKTTND